MVSLCYITGASSTRAQQLNLSRCLHGVLLASGVMAAALVGAPAAQAGPTLESRENTAIGAQATFNNSWAQTFEAKGSMSVEGGDGLLAPFASTGIDTLILPNSGLAQLTATVTEMSVRGGQLDASASVNPLALLGDKDEDNIHNNGNSIVLNSSGEDGLPALRIKPGTDESAVIGASIIGTNIGTESLQVTGSISTTVINTLTAF